MSDSVRKAVILLSGGLDSATVLAMSCRVKSSMASRSGRVAPAGTGATAPGATVEAAATAAISTRGGSRPRSATSITTVS